MNFMLKEHGTDFGRDTSCLVSDVF